MRACLLVVVVFGRKANPTTLANPIVIVHVRPSPEIPDTSRGITCYQIARSTGLPRWAQSTSLCSGVVLVWRIEDIGAIVVRELRTTLIGRKSSFALSQFAVDEVGPAVRRGEADGGEWRRSSR
jgi:hypothetical protein